MKYNRKNFEKFLKKNCKNKEFNFVQYCNDLENQYYNNGFRMYELSKFESSSGNTEIFNY